MKSFLKTIHSVSNKRNALVRESLQKLLNTSIMEVLGAPGVTEEQSVGNCDEAMTLCSVLEAIFLHGLKDSLLNRVTEVLSGPDFDAMPQPSFWGPLLVFSHRQIIDQIQKLIQVKTEVGYCRAWIRLALNEGLLSSYLAAIRRDNSALKPYYDRGAFIRDPDLVDVAQRSIESIDHIKFELACNTSLLNIWSSTPLLMAGVWSPPMKSCPVFSAVDIAKTINSEPINGNYSDEVETASSIGSISSFDSSHSALNRITRLNEDEALKIILAKERSHVNIPQTRDHSIQSSPIKKREVEGLLEQKETMYRKEQMDSDRDMDSDVGTEDCTFLEGPLDELRNDSDVTAVGNSLFRKVGWSTSLEDSESLLTTSAISCNSGTDGPRTPADGATYDALIQSYHATGYATTPNLHEFLSNYPAKKNEQKEYDTPTNEVKATSLEDQLGRLPREKGLDLQNYSCLGCGQPIGMKFSKACVCSFSGDYYCSSCMATDEFLIPSRMIHNWDLRRYPVSQKAADYLTNCPTLLDLKILNPRIYMAVDNMAQLQSLRIQLNLLRAYLFTCREPIIESLQKKVAPKDYLYEHVHQYSLTDLLDVPNGSLAQQLHKVVQFARDHVMTCWLCSQKGFICEICNNPKVIYPFDMDSTYRCLQRCFPYGMFKRQQALPKVRTQAKTSGSASLGYDKYRCSD
ncbi:protein RUBCNL-like isoform X2 [Orussus abietinus]|uniref:protein RUBCNL-like isoform X2 n=1 Tax=Orussus abietinus TaxID=222816 RepID=UPI000625340F|nr:protein RUBCNL-like isoform X2 [Orussus abietinus]